MALFYKLHLAVDENPKWFPNHQILNTKLVNLNWFNFILTDLTDNIYHRLRSQSSLKRVKCFFFWFNQTSWHDLLSILCTCPGMVSWENPKVISDHLLSLKQRRINAVILKPCAITWLIAREESNQKYVKISETQQSMLNQAIWWW